MKVLIADDHALFRSGLRHLLVGIAAELAIEESCDFEETFAILSSDQGVDLLLLDLRMPGMSGIGSLRRLLMAAPGVPIVIISASEDTELMNETLAAGAMGYIPKSETSGVMRHAIELVLGGGVYVPPALLQLARSKRSTASPELTPRQKDVLRLIIEGNSNKEIAHALGLSIATVKAHLSAVFRALDVSNRAQATEKSRSLGLFPDRESDPP